MTVWLTPIVLPALTQFLKTAPRPPSPYPCPPSSGFPELHRTLFEDGVDPGSEVGVVVIKRVKDGMSGTN